MTERLYYQDCYLQEFRARVIETSDDGRRVYLDRTAFYPSSGGQPFDTGGAPRWNRTGESFESLTLAPSIRRLDNCGWHGFITNGEVITV